MKIKSSFARFDSIRFDRSIDQFGKMEKIGYWTGIIDRQVGSSCGSARRATATL